MLIASSETVQTLFCNKHLIQDFYKIKYTNIIRRTMRNERNRNPNNIYLNVVQILIQTPPLSYSHSHCHPHPHPYTHKGKLPNHKIHGRIVNTMQIYAFMLIQSQTSKLEMKDSVKQKYARQRWKANNFQKDETMASNFFSLSKKAGITAIIYT